MEKTKRHALHGNSFFETKAWLTVALEKMIDIGFNEILFQNRLGQDEITAGKVVLLSDNIVLTFFQSRPCFGLNCFKLKWYCSIYTCSDFL